MEKYSTKMDVEISGLVSEAYEMLKEEIKKRKQSGNYETIEEFRARIPQLVKEENWPEFIVGMLGVAERDWEGYKKCLVDLMVETEVWPATPWYPYQMCTSNLNLVLTGKEYERCVQDLRDSKDEMIDEVHRRRRGKS